MKHRRTARVMLTALASTLAFAGALFTVPSLVTSAVASTASAPYDSAVSALSPSAWWQLNDPAGSTTAADSSGNGYTGSVAGSVTFGQTGPITGTTGAAFDGSTGYITTTAPQPATSSMTYIAWFKTTASLGPNGVGGGAVMLSSRDAGGYPAFTMALDAGHLLFGYDAAGAENAAQSSSTYNDGNWHMAVGVWKGTTGTAFSTSQISLYLDGSPASASTVGIGSSFTAPLPAESDAITIGTNASGWNLWSGALADTTVIPAALTAAQVRTLYQDAMAAPPSFTSSSTITVGQQQSNSFTVTTAGTVPSLNETGALPAGIAFVDNGNGTATISGTPTGSLGSYPITITATNPYGTATQSATIAVTMPFATLSYTGATQSSVVPIGVTSATVDMAGAQGGSIAGFGAGGLGARVEGSFAVTPGEKLYVGVGGAGNSVGGVSAFGGGGVGGTAPAGTPSGGGGGASYVYIGSTTSSGLMAVAGGGGGGAYSGPGGDGGLTGSAGTGSFAGGGASLLVGGSSGGSAESLNAVTAGTAWSLTGSSGGSGGNVYYGSAGGGGGGGYYGGGGAGGYNNYPGGSSGGGGASLVPSGGVATTGYEAGNGYVQIIYGTATIASASTTPGDASYWIATLDPGVLSFVSTPPDLTFPAVTIDGQDQSTSASLPLDVGDNTGTGAGWNVTITSTQFSDGSATLPASATSINIAPSSTCDVGASCTPATLSSSVTYPVTIPAGSTAPTATRLYSAVAGSGMGDQTLSPDFTLAVPANAAAGAYSSDWTLSLVSGP